MLTTARRHLLTTALLAGGVASIAAAPAQAAAPKCPQRATEVARGPLASFWTDRGKLWSCTVEGRLRPHTRLLGTWTRQSTITLGNGSVMGWTYRARVGGKAVDMVAGADLSRTGRNAVFQPPVRPAFGPGSSGDLRVAAMVAQRSGLAWVTRGGRVVVALSGVVTELEPVGLGTPGASDPAAVDAGAGLLAAPLQRGRRVVLGRWTASQPAALAATLKIDILGREADECSWVEDYRVTVTPLPGQAPVGISTALRGSSDAPSC